MPSSCAGTRPQGQGIPEGTYRSLHLQGGHWLLHRAQSVPALFFELRLVVIFPLPLHLSPIFSSLTLGSQWLTVIDAAVGCCHPQQRPLCISPIQPPAHHFGSSSSSCLWLRSTAEVSPQPGPPAPAYSEGSGCWGALVRLPQPCAGVCPLQPHGEVPPSQRLSVGAGLC